MPRPARLNQLRLVPMAHNPARFRLVSSEEWDGVEDEQACDWLCSPLHEEDFTNPLRIAPIAQTPDLPIVAALKIIGNKPGGFTNIQQVQQTINAITDVTATSEALGTSIEHILTLS